MADQNPRANGIFGNFCVKWFTVKTVLYGIPLKPYDTVYRKKCVRKRI